MWRSTGPSARDLAQPLLERPEILGRQGSDMLVADGAVGADDEGFGDTVDAPVDGGAAVRIDADGGVRVAEGAEEAAGVVGIVLLVDADHADRRVAREIDQERVLL